MASAVDLELALEGRCPVGHLLGQPVGPGPQLLGAEGVVQAHHRDVVRPPGRTASDGAAPTCAVGESGTARSGCSASMAAQLADERVVLGVGDLGVVEHVVALVVVGDERPAARRPGPPGRRRGPSAGRAVGRAHRTIPEPDHGVRARRRRRGRRSGPGPPGAGARRSATRRPVGVGRATVQGTGAPWALHWASAPRDPSGPGAGGPVDPGHACASAAPGAQRRLAAGRRVTRRAGTSTAVTKRRRPSVPWPMPRRWPTVTSSTAVDLAEVGAGVVVDQAPGVQRHPVAEEPGPARVGADEADVLAVGLGRGAQPEPGGLGPDLVLGQVPHREDGTGRAGPGPAWTARRTGPWPRRPRAAAGRCRRRRAPTRAWWPVATASNPRRPARSSSRSNLRWRLHSMHGLGVRPAAWPGHVGVDHVGLEVGGEVEDVVDDAELVGHPAGVVDVGHRAAPRVGRRRPTA